MAQKYWRSVAIELAAMTDAENDPSVLGTCGTNASSSPDDNKAAPCSSGVGNGGALFSLAAPSASDVSGTDDGDGLSTDDKAGDRGGGDEFDVANFADTVVANGGGGAERIGRRMGGCDAVVGRVLAGGFFDDVLDRGTGG